MMQTSIARYTRLGDMYMCVAVFPTFVRACILQYLAFGTAAISEFEPHYRGTACRPCIARSSCHLQVLLHLCLLTGYIHQST